MGLRFRLVLFLLVPMILVVAAYAYVRLQEERGQRRADFDLRVSVASTAIRLAVENALRSGTLSDVERLAKDLVVKQTEIVRIRLLDGNLTPRVDANLLAGDAGVPLGTASPGAGHRPAGRRGARGRRDPASHRASTGAILRERRRSPRGPSRRGQPGGRSPRRELQDGAAAAPSCSHSSGSWPGSPSSDSCFGRSPT